MLCWRFCSAARGWRVRMRYRLALGSRASTGRGAVVRAGYGGVIELLQAGLSTTRSAEWLDALANAAGASLAVLFIEGLRCMNQK